MGVSRTIYVNVDSPILGFSYSNFSGKAQCKKTPCIKSSINRLGVKKEIEKSISIGNDLLIFLSHSYVVEL